MIKYLKADPWRIIEEEYNPKQNQSSESIFSIGNGSFGQRANFEEKYSGKSLQGSYIAGVYYPDKTRVGWWKNGYPEYFAKVLNSVNWIGIRVIIGAEELDLSKTEVKSFTRILDMKTGLLERIFTVTLKNGITAEINTQRFCSMAEKETAAISYKISIDQPAEIELVPYLDANVNNADSNYDHSFWQQESRDVTAEYGYVSSSTLKTKFHVASAMRSKVSSGSEQILPEYADEAPGLVSQSYKLSVQTGQTVSIEKYITVCSTLNHSREKLKEIALS